METSIKVLLFALALYFMFPKSGKRCLVLLDTTGGEDEIINLKNMDFVYKIEKNLESHMEYNKDLSKLEKWDYVVVTEISENPEKFASNLQKQSFITNTEVIPFNHETLKLAFANTFIALKGVYVKYITGAKLTPAEEVKDGFEKIKEAICGMVTKASVINIVNILNIKDIDEFSVYEGQALESWFSIVGARVPLSGPVLEDSWTKTAVVEYPRSGFCSLALSAEMKNYVEYKKRGLADSQTYMTVRIK